MGVGPVTVTILRKIRATKCSAEAKKAYIDKLVAGGVSVLIPLISLSAEHVSRAVHYADDVESKDLESKDLIGDSDPFCHQLFRGTSAISLQLLLTFSHWVITRIESDDDDNHEEVVMVRQMATLELKHWLKFVKVGILGVSMLLGIFLFGIRKEGRDETANTFKVLKDWYYIFI